MESETSETLDAIIELVGKNTTLISDLQKRVAVDFEGITNNLSRVISVADKQHDTIMSEHNRLDAAFRRIITLEILLAIETMYLIYKFI